MRRQIIIVALLAALIVLYLMRHRQTTTNSHETNVAPEDKPSSEVETPRASGRDRPSPLVVPFEAARRLTAEQIWARKHNGPVAFYAKVIDQNGAPIQGVSLQMTLSVFDEGMFVNDKDRVHDNKLQAYSDVNGNFDVKQNRGAYLRIESVEKERYLWRDHGLSGLSALSYGMNTPKRGPTYATPSQRLVFHMWKKGVTESTVQQGVRVGLVVEQETYGVNLLTGKKVGANESPDLVIRIPLVTDTNGAARGDRLFIFEIPDGGILETADVYPYSAPREGYQPNWEWLHEIGKNGTGFENWRRNFYVKARNGRVYAGLSIAWGYGSTAFEINVIANPAGSPILEPDPEKLITDPEEIRRLDEQTRVK